jgi:hypothetical protein
MAVARDAARPKKKPFVAAPRGMVVFSARLAGAGYITLQGRKMMRESWSRSSLVAWGLAAATGAFLLTGSATAQADDVSPTGKGITGGALLGAEAITLTEAAFGLKSGWLYLLGAAVGGGAGAYGGYLVEKDGNPQSSLYMLAGGMALVIPTTVAILQATSYQPPEDYTEDRPPPAGTPVSEPPRAPAVGPGAAPGPAPGSAPAPAPTPAPAPAPASLRYHWAPGRVAMPLALLDLTDGAPHVGVPAVEVRPVYSMAEVTKYGLAQEHELRLPVLSATF